MMALPDNKNNIKIHTEAQCENNSALCVHLCVCCSECMGGGGVVRPCSKI